MSKNNKNRHKNTGPAGKSGPGSPATGSVSLSTFRAERAMDALTPAFVQWLDDGAPGAAAAALRCLEQVKTVAGRYMDSTAAAEVTGFEPIPLAIAISDEVAATVHASGGEMAVSEMAAVENAVFVVDAVHTFVDFLSETGRWSGSAEQLAGVMDFFDTIAEEADGRGYIDVPDISEEQTLEVFSELPLIQRATALLQWIGEGRPVTGTGALRLRDIEAAAACVGVTVRGGTKRAESALPGTAASADSVPTVRSMYEVPLLAQMWAALEASELIELKSTKVVPFEDAEGFLTGGASERLEEFFTFTACFLEQAVLGFDQDQPWERPIAGLQTSILIAAATADPPLLERVLAAADFAPEAEKKTAGLMTSLAVGRLEALAELGLLTIDSHFRMPPALIGCVAEVFDHDWVLADLGLEEDPDDADIEPTVAEPAALQSPVTAARPAATSTLQLKIMLKGSKPPIWRRVLVPGGMPLTQLHQAIQALFGWLDYHLHQFQTGGFRGPTYAPVSADGEDDSYGEPSSDESKVTVGELLPAVGSTMTYTYDFGDDWEHAITVEKILADDGGGQLPRCTAGRGAAPAEDSGGTWGWANIVQAVNDPGHEEHEEYREWLGLQPGERVDPKAFDVDQANGDLADLF
ncbi:plasmid pRiA4b ORF-3 family protein [Arthrobacter sp. UYCu723]